MRLVGSGAELRQLAESLVAAICQREWRGGRASIRVPDVALGEKWGKKQGWGVEKSSICQARDRQMASSPPSALMTVMAAWRAEDLGQGLHCAGLAFPFLPPLPTVSSRAHALPAATAGSPGGRQPGRQMQKASTLIPRAEEKKPGHSAQPSSLSSSPGSWQMNNRRKTATP